MVEGRGPDASNSEQGQVFSCCVCRNETLVCI